MQPANLYLMGRPDLISTFTKIELWKQTQYKRIVYLDADMVALRAPNELLNMDTNFAAVPDVGWPDCFNSGLMVLNPNMAEYYSLLALAQRGISFDGADQGLLNMHFTDWERLSFTHNCTPSANYQYVPAYRHFQSSISMIHFIGAEKPWAQGRDHRSNQGVYGELLARWWSVYDRHYRRPKVAGFSQFTQPQRRVQDYVRGEETIDEPEHQSQPQPEQRRRSSGYQITQPHPQPPPGIHAMAPQDDHAASMERPMGDQPGDAERIGQVDYKPTSTQEQRRWWAPQTEWEPTRQPPPPNSKPEAVNFPTQQYEMSDSKQLFEPPEKYPEPPKDMWYQVPETRPAPAAPPKILFPWEERAPKPTRVFPKSKESTPSPEQEAQQSTAPSDTSTAQQGSTTSPTQDEAPRRSSFSETLSQALSQPSVSRREPSPPRHVFPWESRARRPTRVFPQERPPGPPPTTRAMTTDGQSSTTDNNEAVPSTRQEMTTPRSPDNPWDTFAQQGNTWDEDPDIARFMEGFNKPRKAPVQVVHDSRSQPGAGAADDGPPPSRERRTSLKLTDFPTEIERPSLPVTPAPIRRSSYFGMNEPEGQNAGDLAMAKGVPRQDEWVRRFTSQFLPQFPNPDLRDIGGVLHLTCQHCGLQNPFIKLDELQRRQSLIATGEQNLVEGSKTPPKREQPGSKSREEVIEAAMKGLNAGHGKPRTPTKPILREPHFEMMTEDDADLTNEQLVSTAHMNATGSKSPTRFNPVVLEGEAASERNTHRNVESLLDEEDQEQTATHHHNPMFPYSTSSLSPENSRTNLNNDMKKAGVDGEITSPTTAA